jgi:hypothetical protein
LSSVGDGLRWLLPMSDEFRRQYSLLSYVSYQPTADHRQFLLHQSGRINQCDVLICHHPDGSPFADRDGYISLLAGFPASTRKIFVPAPEFTAFWPFHREEQKSLPLGMYQPFWPHYRDDAAAAEPNWAADVRGDFPSYPFGDNYVLEKWQEGRAPEEIISGYRKLDVASVADLEGLASQCLRKIQQDEFGADIKIADFVASAFRDRKLFAAPDLGSNLLHLYMTNGILKLLSLPTIPERILLQLQLLIKIEAPIHPSIGRFFGAPYVGEETRYFVDRHRRLTFAEYIGGYVEWLAREERRRPEFQLERATSAAAAGD